VQVRVTGAVALEGPARTVDGAALAGRQGRVVLASLAVAEQPVAREVLADRVWGDGLPRAWERDLSAVVSKLRSALVRAGLGDTDVITSDGTSYQLHLPAGATVDLRRALDDADRAVAAVAAGDLDEAAVRAAASLEVASRPFLPAEDAPWVDEVRGRLRVAHLQALEARAAAATGRGEAATAEAALTRLLELEPYRESAVRDLMDLQVRAGRRAEAVQVYEQLRARLATDLGLDPAPETREVHLAALRHDRPSTAPTASGPDADAVPEIRYARSGSVSVAYQVVGDGPVDLVFVPGWISNLEITWQEPHLAAFLRELAAHCRLILFDKRGTGLSDPIPLEEPPPLEVRMDDVTAVMDAAGSERAVLFGFSEGGAMSLLFAASHPDRTIGLVLWGAWARQLRDEDFPYGWTVEEGRRRFVAPIRESGRAPASWFVPGREDDPAFQAWWARFTRHSASPGMALALLRANARMDVRHVLGSVRVPTLVLHRTDDVLVQVEQGRYISQHVPGARMVELPGRDHWPWFGEGSERILREAVAFLGTLDATTPRTEQVLASLVAVPGRVPTDQDEQVVATHRGLLVEQHDGLLARFDGPGRAVRAAVELARSVAAVGVGVHTGEVTLRGAEVSGHAVEVVRALAATAGPGEVLVTRTVTDLVAGSTLSFDEAVPRDLGVVGTWPVARSA
jgi:pimeloyl-ACP methyl ester carboxylesterase/DNA-binding SARP family transcriptional activator